MKSISKPPHSVSLSGALKKTRQFFSSIKLALALILLTGACSLFGTFVPSANVFHSWWFLTAGALLMLNIIVCTFYRWGNIKLSLQGGSIKQEESFYFSGACRAEISIVPQPDDHTSQLPVNILRKLGYRVRTEDYDGNHYLAADKNRYFRLGTFASHLSLVLFVLAYLLGSYFGFRDAGFTVAAGNTRPVLHNTGLSLQLVSFTDEYYADNTPKDYRSDVILYENGQIVKQAVVRVNHPLTYKGISLHQMFFGPAVQLQITQNGQPVYQGTVPLDKLINNQGLERYVGSLDLPGGLNAQLIGSAINVQDPLIPPGQLAIYLRQQNGTQIGAGVAAKGAALTINGIDFSYQADAKFSGFQVSRDPGSALIWVASILFILGVTLVLYFPYRQVWMLHKIGVAADNRLVIRLGTPRGFNGNAELKSLTEKIEKTRQYRSNN